MGDVGEYCLPPPTSSTLYTEILFQLPKAESYGITLLSFNLRNILVFWETKPSTYYSARGGSFNLQYREIEITRLLSNYCTIKELQ